MKHCIGCSGFHNKDWKNVFYPERLPQNKWFEYYSGRFNTLELNTTFYRFPRIEILKKWYEKSPPGFKISVKAPRLITHYKQLKDAESLLNDFYTTIAEGLLEKLGAVLFQFPAKIACSNEFLQRIIQNLNTSFNNVVEFRHASWWDDHVFQQLAQNNISFCGINIENLPDTIIDNTSLIYYRFHGKPHLYYSQYPLTTIKNFAEALKEKAGVKTVYVYFNNTATIAAINNAVELENELVI
jgi:uncharacterized protein YecE (DUF72 family)